MRHIVEGCSSGPIGCSGKSGASQSADKCTYVERSISAYAIEYTLGTKISANGILMYIFLTTHRPISYRTQVRLPAPPLID